ncbi:tannase/feruloyl esterase family alpha/beta hydrolase [Thiofilum flexile]|uniref:tannase/feruloyl esterase family alpha/beta hydrolase n=1 Tax=Thiofilum flexile TaxID=125627 RepID=UPI0003772FB2|nr:tannase/feruloyl esterase family alpha/beta hydrolase [Thiofilum flexile]
MSVFPFPSLTRKVRLVWCCSLGLGLAALSQAAWAEAPKAAQSAAQICTSLAGLQLATVKFEKSEFWDAKQIKPDAFSGFTGAIPDTSAVGEHCLVRGIIGERTGVDNKPYGTQFELRLPVQWNNKFLFQGGGGVDGFVAPALGGIPCRGSTAKPALARGYAVVSMDGGHPTPDPSFGSDQAARIDFAYASIGKVTPIAKQIITAFYGKDAQKTLFMGCSNGGREAMIAAQRYPTEFDGVVAGNPGFRLTKANLAEAWDTQQFLRIAPKDAEGNPILAQAFSQQDLDLVSKAVLNACDAKDGIEDGLINAWQQCSFKPDLLVCKGDKEESCLTAEQVSTLHKVFDGPQNAAGNKLYSDWPYDAGISAPNWRVWKLGNSQTAKSDALNVLLGGGSLSLYFMTPPDPTFKPTDFDFERDPARLEETGKLNDATTTYLTTFVNRGGKLVLFQGLSDPVFSANDLVSWYQGVVQASAQGDVDKARDFVRLFMVPGMTHCGDGPALDNFDPLTALETWMEQGKAPDFLAASGKAFPDKEQPICAYPQQAMYDGKSDPKQLTSYQCR